MKTRFMLKMRGFPNCPPATSQIGNSFIKTSVISVQDKGPDGVLKIKF